MKGKWVELDIDVKTKCRTEPDGRITCIAIQERDGKRTGFEQTTKTLSEKEIGELEKTF